MRETERGKGGLQAKRKTEKQRRSETSLSIMPPQGPAVFCTDRTSLPASYIRRLKPGPHGNHNK